MIDPEEQRRVERKLDLNERLVWAGRPKPKAFSKASVAMMLFGIPWIFITAMVSGGFALSWAQGAMNDKSVWERVFLCCFFIPFWAIGISCVFAPLWQYLRMRRQIYAVTDKSALVIGAFFTKRWRRREIGLVDRADRRSGYSDLLFSQTSYSNNGQHFATGFHNIPTTEAAAAERALNALREGAE